MRHGPWTACGLVGVVGLFLAGCGPSAKTPLDSAFATRANAVCKPVSDFDRTHHFPINSFDPTNPTPAQLTVVGKFLADQTDYPKIPAELDALGEPPRYAAEWDRMRSLVRQQVATSAAQRDAALKQDVTAFAAAVRSAGPLSDSLIEVATSLGFTPKTNCGRIFG